MKNIRVFLTENYQFLEVKFSMYLNRRVFIMDLVCSRSLGIFFFNSKSKFYGPVNPLGSLPVQSANSFCLGAGLVLLAVHQYLCKYFVSYCQLCFLNQQKGMAVEIISRSRYMKSCVVELRFKLVSPGSAVRHTADCAMEPGGLGI